MTDRLTTEEIQDLRAKSAAATKGPWLLEDGCFVDHANGGVADCMWEKDAPLIVTMRNTLDRLLEELLEHREREADSKHRIHFRDEDGRGFTVQSAQWFGASSKGFPKELELYGTGDMGRGELRRYVRMPHAQGDLPMTKPKKPTKRKPASVLAWCALYDGKVKPGWCCQHRSIAKRWAANNPGGELVRVRITVVPKESKR